MKLPSSPSFHAQILATFRFMRVLISNANNEMMFWLCNLQQLQARKSRGKHSTQRTPPPPRKPVWRGLAERLLDFLLFLALFKSQNFCLKNICTKHRQESKREWGEEKPSGLFKSPLNPAIDLAIQASLALRIKRFSCGSSVGSSPEGFDWEQYSTANRAKKIKNVSGKGKQRARSQSKLKFSHFHSKRPRRVISISAEGKTSSRTFNGSLRMLAESSTEKVSCTWLSSLCSACDSIGNRFHLRTIIIMYSMAIFFLFLCALKMIMLPLLARFFPPSQGKFRLPALWIKTQHTIFPLETFF